MNTNTVAKRLNISPSTVKRWILTYGLKVDRNEHGHYVFSEDHLLQLSDIQEQFQASVPAHQFTAGTSKVDPPAETDYKEEILAKFKNLEMQMSQKADSVASYQLLQHRGEIEDLHKAVAKLTARIEELEHNQNGGTSPSESMLVFDQQKSAKKPRKKKLLNMIFSF